MISTISSVLGRKRGVRLHITITLIFVLLTLPVTVIFGVVTYRSNQQLIEDHTTQFIQKSSIENTTNANKLLGGMFNTMRTATTLMRDNSDYFQGESSADYLQEIVTSNSGIRAASAIFADGSLHQVRRAVTGETILGKAIPPTTQFISRIISSNLDPALPGSGPAGFVDSYSFQAPWGVPVGANAGTAQDDPRERAFYKKTLKLKKVNISDPYDLPDSDELGVTLSSPVILGERPIGVIAIDLTLQSFSQFLETNKRTPNSLSIMIDDADSIVAHPQFELGVIKTNNGLIPKRLDKLADQRVLSALGERIRSGKDTFIFNAGADKAEYLAMFMPIPQDFNKPWRVLTITPTNDFVGEIRRTNRNMLLFSVVAFLLQVVLIYAISRMIAQPIEQLAREVMNIREFRFDETVKIKSSVREISYLSDAIMLLERALMSFTSYVPTVLVKQLMESGQATKLGVESRFLTILFTDIEGFSSLSESEPSQRLLSRVSDYFATVTKAVEREHGTVDKFIGDAVMAFWGAPKILENHAYLACVAAMRAQRGMAALNQAAAEQKQPPLKLRIGIHCDAVLVGNVGSQERISYTVMGDGVNVAARLEGINKEMGTWTCVSHHIFREAGHLLWLRPIDTVTVKGRKGELLVYELLGIRGDDSEIAASDDDIILCDMTQDAYAAFAKGDFRQAVALYGKILEKYPHDQVARRMLEKSRVEFHKLSASV